MDFSAPFEALFPAVDSAVMAVLAGSTKPRTGREVARLAGRSQAATQRVLDRLVENGLVVRTEAGRSRVYELNRDHLAAQPVEALSELRRQLFMKLRDLIASLEPRPVHVSVFGSVARGDSDLHSDVDIFLVRPKDVDEDDDRWRDSVDAIAEQVLKWTGNHAGIAAVGEAELDRLSRDRPPIVASLERDAVDVFGAPLRELLRQR